MGHQIGEAFRAVIQDTFEGDTELLDAYGRESVQPLLNATIEFHKAQYPLYWAEVEGLAEGSELPVRLIAAANFRQEITSITGKAHGHCTDVYFMNESMFGIAHNEDFPPLFFNSMYVVSATFGPEQGNPHTITAFHYAAVLAGWSVSLQTHFVFSVNLLFPQISGAELVDDKLLSVTFALRDVLAAPDIETAIHRTGTRTLRYGYSLNLVNVEKKEMHQIEAGPGGLVSQFLVSRSSPTVGAHANRYLQLNNLPQIAHYQTSSLHRMARFQQMQGRVKGPEDLLMVLGDTYDREYPLFRSAIPPDTSSTLATWALDLEQRAAYVYRHRPDGSLYSPTAEYWSRPLLRIPFPAQDDGPSLLM